MKRDPVYLVTVVVVATMITTLTFYQTRFPKVPTAVVMSLVFGVIIAVYEILSSLGPPPPPTATV